MTSSYARKRDRRQYRYYVSQAILKQTSIVGVEVPRIAAMTIEQLVQGALPSTQHTTKAPWLQSVRKVVMRAKEVKIEFARDHADDQENEALQRMAITVNFHKCGGRTQIMPTKRSTQDVSPAPNRTLIRALIPAHRCGRSWSPQRYRPLTRSVTRKTPMPLRTQALIPRLSRPGSHRSHSMAANRQVSWSSTFARFIFR